MGLVVTDFQIKNQAKKKIRGTRHGFLGENFFPLIFPASDCRKIYYMIC